MAATIAADSVHFCGSAGHNDNGGGVRKSIFQSNSMSDFVGADGAAKYSKVGSCQFRDNGGMENYLKIQNIDSTGIVEGTIAYFEGGGAWYSGARAKVELVGSGYVVLATPYSVEDRDDGTIRVGGGFPTIQDAFDSDETDATSYDRYIIAMSNETLAATLDLDTGGGGWSTNKHKYLIGDKFH